MLVRRSLGLWLCSSLIGLLAGLGSAQEEDQVVVRFEPADLVHVIEGTVHEVTWSTPLDDVSRVTASVEDQMVAEVVGVSDVTRSAPGGNATHYGSLNVSALFIGYNKVRVTLFDRQDVVVGEGTLDMSVLLSYQKINDIFTLTIGILVAVVYINMGATMDLKIIKNISKKPIGPLLGIVCQYLFMPLIAFGLGKLAFPENVLAQLGMFLTGCSPGGGLSNMWTYLLGGSLDLSILMTFTSTIFAFATLPLWVFLMGPVILGETDFAIPYKDIAMLVVSLSVPCCVGILVQRFLPRVAKVLEWLLTPLSIFIVVFIFTFGVYANIYVFSFFDLRTLLVGFGLPTIGYLTGLLAAKLFRLPTQDVIAISIETGVQNASVAIFILKFTLEKPAGDLTVVFPAASTVMTPVPLLLVLIAQKIYSCTAKSKSADIAPLEGKAGLENKKNNKKNEKGHSTQKEMKKQFEGGVDNPAVQLQDEAV
ncbi:sodium/bile acid cotransporter-like isoform X2 [Penaeus chinensis]|uniref:sodium/bile acid cotransporter-like isoform X2 n=1 Tax=Penaeus chinensis TaxID=139456 RepID=UPI001FB59AE8|nr:sodium/bile acid cotransporter-like isoform X2 [Penaeus chinensis]